MFSFELEYLFEYSTYLGQSSAVVRARAVTHSGSRCCISILFECTSNAGSCTSTEEWRTVLVEGVTFLLSQQDLIPSHHLRRKKADVQPEALLTFPVSLRFTSGIALVDRDLFYSNIQ